MSEKIVQLNEEVIKGQIKELVRGSVEEMLVAVTMRQAFSCSVLSKGFVWCINLIKVFCTASSESNRFFRIVEHSRYTIST